MPKFFTIILLSLLAGCTTNQLHFAAYTSETELAALKQQSTDVDVTAVTGTENCSACTERSNIVWHAANYNGALYQGYAALPIKDWEAFVQDALESRPQSAKKVKIVIERIFLKTWSDPAYYACQAEISVFVGTTEHKGKGIVKIHAPGQQLIRADLATLNPETLAAIRLSLKSAYLDAMGRH